MGKFGQMTLELWPLVEVLKIAFFSFPFSNFSSLLPILFKLCI